MRNPGAREARHQKHEVSDMTRQEKRTQRAMRWRLERDAASEASRLDYKLAGESGALVPPVKHPGRRRWGGPSGTNANGASNKRDRSHETLITHAPLWHAIDADNAVLETTRLTTPITQSAWNRLLDND